MLPALSAGVVLFLINYSLSFSFLLSLLQATLEFLGISSILHKVYYLLTSTLLLTSSVLKLSTANNLSIESIVNTILAII